jgi:hypothetical protein
MNEVTPQTFTFSGSYDSSTFACVPSQGERSYQLVVNDTRSGNSLQGWRRRVIAHQGATTVFDGVKHLVAQRGGAVYLQFVSETPGLICGQPHGTPISYSASGCLYSIPYLPAPLSSYTDPSGQAISDASEQYYSNLRESYEKFSGATFLGELKETIDMIRHPGKSLINGIKQYLRELRSPQLRHLIRRYRNNRNVRAVLADTYLEYAYGWAPLLSDIDAGIAAYAKLTYNKLQFEHVQGSGHHHLDNLVESSFQQVFGIIGIDVRFKTYADYDARFLSEVSITTNSSFNNFDHLLEVAGFDIINFAPTIYELIPGSFLLDYFSNLGGIIQAVCTRTGHVVWINRTQRAKNYSVYNGNLIVPTSNGPQKWSGSGDCGEVVLITTKVHRDAPASVEYPSFSFQAPNFGQVFNIAALIAANVKTRRYLNS